MIGVERSGGGVVVKWGEVRTEKRLDRQLIDGEREVQGQKEIDIWMKREA